MSTYIYRIRTLEIPDWDEEDHLTLPEGQRICAVLSHERVKLDTVTIRAIVETKNYAAGPVKAGARDIGEGGGLA